MVSTRAMRMRLEATEEALQALVDRFGLEAAVARFVRVTRVQTGRFEDHADEIRDGAEGPPIWRSWWTRTGEYQWTFRSAWLVDLETLGSPPAESADQ
jgi:hypothetical protein